nr:biotin-dependent carboxyltransferase family protein [Bacillus sp. FJAT-49736]
MLTTLQDSGRTGFQRFGFVVSGAMDSWAMQLANSCLGNNQNEAVLEMTLLGATFEFEADTEVCFCGANMNPTLNGKPVYNGTPISVKKGDILEFHNAEHGCRAYLAVKGGFISEDILHSKSTYIKAGIGKKLEAGDRLLIREIPMTANKKWRLSPSLFTYINSETIRFTEGRQYGWLSPNAFETRSYQVEVNSDRMGYRLNGDPVFLQEKRELITEGAAFGTIQIPPNGQPIILMVDRQPTGGYPKIGEVITADLPKIAQRKPGDFIRFQKVSIQEAQATLLERNKLLNMLQTIIRKGR